MSNILVQLVSFDDSNVIIYYSNLKKVAVKKNAFIGILVLSFEIEKIQS